MERSGLHAILQHGIPILHIFLDTGLYVCQPDATLKIGDGLHELIRFIGRIYCQCAVPEFWRTAVTGATGKNSCNDKLSVRLKTTVMKMAGGDGTS